MRKALLVAIVWACFAATATAQPPIRFGAKAGWQWPEGREFKDGFGNGWIVGLDVTSRGRLLGLGIDAKATRKKQEFVAGDVSADATWTSVPISGNVYLNLFVDQGSTLYVAGGPTVIYTRISGQALGGGFGSRFAEDTWSWGWNAIAGADSGRVFIEGQLLRVSDEGLKLGSFNLVLGYRF